MMGKHRNLILTGFLLGVWVPGLAQSADERPRIGVALSGGGTRGMAHIGVLQWFEEHQIPIDYLAGTSMGGLIGGLHAMSMASDEMRQIVESLDWNQLLAASPAYSDLTFRRKEDRRAYPGRLQLGWQQGLKTQSSLSDAHFIGLLLSRLALPYSSVDHFDEMPIPFRAVAVDMEGAERIILEEGSLAQALQATIAIPGVFPPVEVNGQLLGDGGLLNNLPTDVVKALGADIVIAVDVGTPLGDRESLASFLGVLNQSIGVMMIENVRQNLLLADIIVSPDLQDYTTMDFSAGPAIVDLGYQAAESKRVFLEALGVNDTQWEQYQEFKSSRRRDEPFKAEFLELEGPSQRDQEEIRRSLEENIGAELQTAALESDLNALYSLGRYRALSYRGITREQEEGLLVEVTPKPHGPPFIDLGFEINGADIDNIRFGVRSRTTFWDVGAYGSEWRVDLGLGPETFARSEYYYPVGWGFFLAPRAFAEGENTPLFEDGQRVAEYKATSAGAGFDLGYGFGSRTHEIRAGYEISNLDARVRIGSPLLPSLEGTVGVASLGWTLDRLDSAVVPRSGFRVELRPNWFFQSPGISGGFPQAELKFAFFQRVGEPNSVFVLGEGGTTFSETAPPAQQLTLGGPLRLGAFHQDEFRGSRLIFSTQGYIHRIGSLPALFGGKIYAGLWHEIGAVFEPQGQRDYLSVLSGGVLAETFLGPMIVGGSWGEGGRYRFYFSVGSLF